MFGERGITVQPEDFLPFVGTGENRYIGGVAEKYGVKTAIATSADRMKMEINLRETGLPAETFDATVNGLQVKHKKPSPEIYLTAAQKLGVEPSRCLVVEDAVNGVQAAKAAGMYCMALTTSFDAEQLKDADIICKDLSEAPDDIFRRF
jgi:beta-phosphoglucomutase-like phosphatase (HAD superfamily)